MHFLMIFIAFALAVSLRLIAPKPSKKWQENWQRSLFFFLFPSLLLLMTFLSVFWMGYRGQMFGIPASWFSYLLSLTVLAVGGFLLLQYCYQAWQTIRKIRTYSQEKIGGEIARILEVNFPYIAQVGFWKSELIVSRGLLNLLDKNNLQAVLAHEQAHHDFHDTFWFFWLGWLRTFTAYLPNTEAWWQELLRLRELRADWQASQQVDAFLLAESLLIVSQAVNEVGFETPAECFSAAFNDAPPPNRLIERIELLLDGSDGNTGSNWWNWGWIVLTLLPLLMVPCHY
jgi:Zn-dependent protease with chaperone function